MKEELRIVSLAITQVNVRYVVASNVWMSIYEYCSVDLGKEEWRRQLKSGWISVDDHAAIDLATLAAVTMNTMNGWSEDQRSIDELDANSN